MPTIPARPSRSCSASECRFPPVVSEMDASVFAAEGTLTGSLGDAASDRLTSACNGGRVGEFSDINVLGGATLDTRALTVSTLAIHAKSGEVVLDGVLPWSGTTGRGTIVAHLREVAELAVGLPSAVAAGGTTRAVWRVERLGSEPGDDGTLSPAPASA